MPPADPTPLDPVRLEAAAKAIAGVARDDWRAAQSDRELAEAAIRAWEAAAPAPVGEEAVRPELGHLMPMLDIYSAGALYGVRLGDMTRDELLLAAGVAIDSYLQATGQRHVVRLSSP